MASSFNFDASAAAGSRGAAENILKEFYGEKKIKEMLYADSPLLALLAKSTNFKGKQMPIPIRIAGPQGRSATFATAQTNRVGSVYKDFVIYPVKDYAVAEIDRMTMKLSESDEGAFIDAATSEVDGAIMAIKRSISWGIYGNGGGRIGVVSNVSTNVITLSDPNDIVHFEVGMTILGNANDFDGTAGTARTAKAVTAIDRDLGKFTLESSHGLQNGDSIFVEGDRGSSKALRVSGLGAWCPSTAPGATAFFGVDRTVDLGRLAGRIYDGSSEPIDEALISAARRVARDGGKPGHVFCSFEKFGELEKVLGPKAMYDMAKDKEVGIGFKALRINGPKGDMLVIPDADCTGDLAYMLQMDTWKLWSVGELAQLIQDDGITMLRESSSDGYEVRCASYLQLACNAPGYNCVVKL